MLPPITTAVDLADGRLLISFLLLTGDESSVRRGP